MLNLVKAFFFHNLKPEL